MKIQLMSDLHLEFSKGEINIPVQTDEKDTILVLAGDIGVATKKATYVPFIEEMSKRFRHIIYVLGNHEFYGGNFGTAHGKILDNLAEFDNVSILDKETKIIDDVAFIGATLWTDMSDSNPILMLDAKLQMNDYIKIRSGPPNEPWKRKLLPVETVADHLRAREFIFDEIVKMKEHGLKVVVVTHHSPSFWSIHEDMQCDTLNGAYVSNLGKRIVELEDNQPEIWIHGHLHNSSDYTIGKTRVINNPRGYYSVQENYEFDPTLRIEV